MRIRAAGRWALAAALVTIPQIAIAQPRRPALGGGGELDISLGRIIVSLVICVIIAVLAILLIRQRSGKIDLRAFLSRIEPRKGEIEIVETRRISVHADICLIRTSKREYLVLLQPTNAHVLHEGARTALDRSCD